ncbi:hypothetical protein AVEN_244702-1, partial [Araneus ventricosus]
DSKTKLHPYWGSCSRRIQDNHSPHAAICPFPPELRWTVSDQPGLGPDRFPDSGSSSAAVGSHPPPEKTNKQDM